MASDRKQHLAWCKTRALEYVEHGDLATAFASMMSDLGKFESALYRPEIMRVLMVDGQSMATARGPDAAQRMKHWIEGFN
jgi:hypothetical protein